MPVQRRRRRTKAEMEADRSQYCVFHLVEMFLIFVAFIYMSIKLCAKRFHSVNKFPLQWKVCLVFFVLPLEGDMHSAVPDRYSKILSLTYIKLLCLNFTLLFTKSAMVLFH